MSCLFPFITSAAKITPVASGATLQTALCMLLEIGMRHIQSQLPGTGLMHRTAFFKLVYLTGGKSGCEGH